MGGGGGGRWRGEGGEGGSSSDHECLLPEFPNNLVLSEEDFDPELRRRM